jgi:hypothetical protein
MVGCLHESLTATLDRFKRSGPVTVGRKRVDIRDRSRLQRIVVQRSGAPVLTSFCTYQSAPVRSR